MQCMMNSADRRYISYFMYARIEDIPAATTADSEIPTKFSTANSPIVGYKRREEKGKERKGKERKGKERKGKERKGKERKGK